MAESRGIDRATVSIVFIGGIEGSICSSYVGRVALPGEGQDLNLGSVCFRKVSLVSPFITRMVILLQVRNIYKNSN